MYKTLVGATLLVVAGSAGAQQSGMAQCAEIEDSLERLVCYDNLSDRQQNQPQKASEKAIGKEKADQQKSRAQQSATQNNEASSAQNFGIEHKSREGSQLDRVEVKVASKEKGPYKKWRIVLSNGQVWKQTGSTSYFSWDDGDTYHIERGALNSFFFGRENSNRRMRVTRVK